MALPGLRAAVRQPQPVALLSFASISLGRRWADLGLILPYAIEDERVRRIDLYGPTSFGHQVRLTRAGEVDADVRRWLADARRSGDQETLNPDARVPPLGGRALAVLRVPVRSRVRRHGDRYGVAIPRHAAEAFGSHPRIAIRITGVHMRGHLESTAEGPVVWIEGDGPDTLGLDAGDETDAYLSCGS